MSPNLTKVQDRLGDIQDRLLVAEYAAHGISHIEPTEISSSLARVLSEIAGEIAAVSDELGNKNGEVNS